MKKILVSAATLGFLGVMLGAFGAHALAQRLAESGHTRTWDTAVLYHLIHVCAALAVTRSGALERAAVRSAWFWLAGVLLFSGSLYVLALGGPSWLGPVTPLGGLFFLLGWANLALAATRPPRD